ncbi:unnamed protein product, partial [Ectocarpus sp. 12 AP-2014]
GVVPTWLARRGIRSLSPLASRTTLPKASMVATKRGRNPRILMQEPCTFWTEKTWAAHLGCIRAATSMTNMVSGYWHIIRRTGHSIAD